MLFMLVGWCLVLGSERMLSMPAFCGPLGASALWRNGDALAMWGLLNPPATLALTWISMLLAMMPPMLAGPIAYLHARSLARRRMRAILYFAIGYSAIWLAAALPLMAAAIATRTIVGDLQAAALLAGLVMALVWQASPWRQYCVNRCHGRPILAVVGWRADIDASRFGLLHGCWCVCVCWAWMLLPMLSDWMHLPLMAAVAVWLAYDRLQHARRVAWRWPLLEEFTLILHHCAAWHRRKTGQS